jgi:hypothetical protein
MEQILHPRGLLSFLRYLALSLRSLFVAIEFFKTFFSTPKDETRGLPAGDCEVRVMIVLIFQSITLRVPRLARVEATSRG